MTSFPSTPAPEAAELTAASLPARPLTLAPGVIAGPRGLWVVSLVMIVIGGALVWWQAPGLLRDWQISRNPVVWADGDIQNGECHTRKAIFTDCEADLVWTVDGQSYASTVALMFVDFHSGDYTVDLVISGDRPDLATLSLGVEKLWNRIIVLGLFMALFFGGALAMAVQKIRARSQSRALQVPGRMLLAPVDIGTVQTQRGTVQVSYVDRATKGAKAPQITSDFAQGTQPMLLADGAGQVRGLAVRHEGAALPALLDAGLTRLDLTAEERRMMLDQITAEQAARGHVIGQIPRRRFAILRGIVTGLGVILFFVLAALGWWLWYVTNGSSQYDALGMEINTIMPAPVNAWACDQLQARFGDQNAPFGCTAADHVSWK